MSAASKASFATSSTSRTPLLACICTPQILVELVVKLPLLVVKLALLLLVKLALLLALHLVLLC
jgi:hypothetical protein